MSTPPDLTEARYAYDTAIELAEKTRALAIAQAIADGMPQKDVIQATGYTRETIRRLTQLGNWYAGKPGAKPPGRTKAPGMNIYSLGSLGHAEQDPTP